MFGLSGDLHTQFVRQMVRAIITLIVAVGVIPVGVLTIIIALVLIVIIVANRKHVRGTVFEESRSPDELERRRFPFAYKGRISENQFHCRLQAWRIGF
jgi:hypothetical protein